MTLTFGVGFPSCREGTAYPPGFVRPKELAPLAQLVERLGYHALWSNDHLTTPRVMRGYLDDRPNFYEPIVTYATLANVTERLRFAFTVVVLPNRDPVLLAKQVATLDQLTDGRVRLAVGIGSDRDEFEAVRPDLKGAHRGVLLEERIQALRLLFSEPEVTLHGRYVHLADVQMEPKPIQQPFPIYVSAREPGGLRRAGRLADGLIFSTLPPESFDEVRGHLAAGAAEVGRDASSISLNYQVNVSFGRTQQEAEERLMRSATFRRILARDPDHSVEAALARFRHSGLVGSPEQVVEQVRVLERAGVAQVGLVFMADSPDDLRSDLELFAREVLPVFQGGGKAAG